MLTILLNLFVAICPLIICLISNKIIDTKTKWKTERGLDHQHGTTVRVISTTLVSGTEPPLLKLACSPMLLVNTFQEMVSLNANFPQNLYCRTLM